MQKINVWHILVKKMGFKRASAKESFTMDRKERTQWMEEKEELGAKYRVQTIV